jgi:hypothetical protein
VVGNPVGARISAPFQTGPEAEQAFSLLRFYVSKAVGACTLNTHSVPSSDVKERVELYLYPPPLRLEEYF